LIKIDYNWLIKNFIFIMQNSKSLINFIIIVVVSLFALYLIKALDISYPITLTNTNKSTELAVVGEGKVEVVPDTAYVDVGIAVNNENTVEAVQKTMNKINNDIITAMKALGIPKTDIKTSNYSIYPNYNYDGKENNISGYSGNASVEIKASSPENASLVIEAATKAGANQVQGSRFVVDKPEKYREQARNAAIANAREQAQKLANSLGIKLGKVVNIVESNPDQGIAVPMARALSSGMGGGEVPSIEPGSQTITSVVTLYFEKR
jgi:uncharacterized protein